MYDNLLRVCTIISSGCTCSVHVFAWFVYSLYVYNISLYITGTPINVTILPPNIFIEWSNKFTYSSFTPFYYEVSVGTRMGSASVLRWLETTDTFVQLTNPQLSLETDYFVTVTAITYAGIHVTDTMHVSGTPIV